MALDAPQAMRSLPKCQAIPMMGSAGPGFIVDAF